jgi:hypothetical protein
MNISHLNATRAALGLGSRARSFGEKNWMPPRGGPQWQTGAGGLLLVAAAQETGLFVALETALTACTPASHSRLKQLSISSRCMLLSTLLFLGVVGPTGCATR